jgi:hypothetical protein
MTNYTVDENNRRPETKMGSVIATKPCTNLRWISERLDATRLTTRSSDSNQLATVLIPQHELRTLQAIANGQAGNLLKLRNGQIAAKQVVASYMAAQMMDVMKPDISR